MSQRHLHWFLALFFLGVLARLIPHLANMTPLIPLCIFAGRMLPRAWALLLVAAILFVSDLALAGLYHYPLVGHWMWFSYSAVFVLVCLGRLLKSRQHFLTLFLSTVAAAFAFWLWSNLGVWLFAKEYPHTISGLGLCYVMALPFLRHQLLGSVLWGVLFFFRELKNVILVTQIGAKCLWYRRFKAR